MRKFSSVLFTVLALCCGWATVALAQNDLQLSIPLPLTGQQAKFGEIEQKAYLIAAEEINAKGGIKKKKLVLTFEDSQGKPEIARSIAEKLIDVKKQPIIF
ncbi:MAG: ABC transporter substrate-binding protein, partial [Desulfovibrio sp.]|nr:ABC transporter substrate-binding protein [Desulfovibrio sp.]